jgi:hypothetical protein
VREACEHAPQEIRVRGQSAVVVLARADDDRPIQPRESLPEFMRRAPLSASDDVELTPDQSLAREVELCAF